MCTEAPFGSKGLPLKCEDGSCAFWARPSLPSPTLDSFIGHRLVLVLVLILVLVLVLIQSVISLCHPLILVALQLKVDKSGRNQILILSYSRSFSQVLSISFLGGWSDLLEQRQILHSFLVNGVWSFCSGVFSLQRSGSSLLGTLMAASTVSYFYEPLYKPFASHHNCEVNIQIYDHSVHSPR